MANYTFAIQAQGISAEDTAGTGSIAQAEITVTVKAQEAGQSDGDLNGGQQPVGRLHQRQQLLCFFVAVFRLLFQLGFRQGDDCDLCRGKNSVDENV